MENSFLKKKLSRGDWTVIVANLIPVYGVWVLGWDAKEAFIVYAMETLIIGIITVLLMTGLILTGKKETFGTGNSRMVGFFFVAFFILHFGIFAAVQTGIFSAVANIAPQNAGMLHFFFHWYTYINKETGIMLGGFIFGYFMQTVLPFLRQNEMGGNAFTKLMIMPYGRIFIQQITVIIGSMFLSFGLGGIFMLVFAATKIFFDVYVNFGGMVNKKIAESEKQKGLAQ
jgi:Family of unknown function (DUF6498)